MLERRGPIRVDTLPTIVTYNQYKINYTSPFQRYASDVALLPVSIGFSCNACQCCVCILMPRFDVTADQHRLTSSHSNSTALSVLVRMYLSTLLLLPLLASADTQEWMDRASGWFDKAKSFAPQQAFPDILDAGAAQVSAKEVQKISVQNWERKLSPKPEGPEEWLIFVTGNKSCHNNCQNIEAQWNVSHHFVEPAYTRLTLLPEIRSSSGRLERCTEPWFPQLRQARTALYCMGCIGPLVLAHSSRPEDQPTSAVSSTYRASQFYYSNSPGDCCSSFREEGTKL